MESHLYMATLNHAVGNLVCRQKMLERPQRGALRPSYCFTSGQLWRGSRREAGSRFRKCQCVPIRHCHGTKSPRTFLVRTDLSLESYHLLFSFIGDGIWLRWSDRTGSDLPHDHVYVINYKTCTGSWEPLFDARGIALYPSLMAELDAIKDLRPTGGLMLRRDGSSLPWFGKGEMLTQVQRITKKIILAAGLRAELTFTSFGGHGGTTEASASGLTETQLMQKGQWSSTATMAHYLHDDDEAKQEAQKKRLKRRARQAKQRKESERLSE